MLMFREPSLLSRLVVLVQWGNLTRSTDPHLFLYFHLEYYYECRRHSFKSRFVLDTEEIVRTAQARVEI